MNTKIIADIAIIVIIAAIIIGIVLYLRREKKRGAKCIGCPYAKECSGGCSGSCGNTQTHG